MEKKMSLSEYLADGVAVLDSGVYYYIKQNGEREPLGSVPIAALNKIRTFEKQKESLQLPSSNQADNPKNESGISDLISKKQSQKNQIDEDQAELDLLIHRRRLVPVGSDLDILIGGLKQTERDNPNVPESHPVKRCNYVFHWPRFVDKVNNGNNSTARGIQVVNRRMLELLSRLYDVQIMRDDTPDLDHVRVGENILCVENKDDFYLRKKKQSFEGSLAPQKSLNQRKEAGKKMASLADRNPGNMDTVRSMLDADERESIKVNAEKKQVSEGLSRPLDQVMAELSESNLSIEDMNKIQSDMAQDTFKARPL